GPPELGMIDANPRSHPLGHHHAAEGQPVTADNTRLAAGQFRQEPQNNAALGQMLLRDADAFEPVFAPRIEADFPPDAGGHKTRAPVPAKLALLLPDHLRATDRVVELPRLMAGAMRTD